MNTNDTFRRWTLSLNGLVHIFTLLPRVFKNVCAPTVRLHASVQTSAVQSSFEQQTFGASFTHSYDVTPWTWVLLRFVYLQLTQCTRDVRTHRESVGSEPPRQISISFTLAFYFTCGFTLRVWFHCLCNILPAKLRLLGEGVQRWWGSQPAVGEMRVVVVRHRVGVRLRLAAHRWVHLVGQVCRRAVDSFLGAAALWFGDSCRSWSSECFERYL